MGTPTETISGSTCILVEMQDHLAIAGTESNGVQSATEMYLIKWDGDATTVDCLGCTDGTTTLPVRGTGHPSDIGLTAARIEIRPAENNSRRIFQVRVEYNDDLNGATNPLDLPPDIQWDVAEDGQVPYFMDFNPAGPKPVVNKAGERFSEFLCRYGGTVSATFSKNIALSAWNPATPIQYCTPYTAINIDGFTFDGFAISQYQARAKGCSCGSIQKTNGVKYRVKKWSLVFKDSWLDKIDNRGFNALVTMDADGGGTVNKLQEIIKGIPPVKPDYPWPLFDSGHAMPNVTDVPEQLTFYPYPQLPFSTLGFS